MKSIVIVLVTFVALSTMTLAAIELRHRTRFGDFVGYGLHTDIVLGNSDVASNDTYFARLWNVSVTPLTIQGCLFPSDVIGQPPAIVFHWDIQRWNLSRKQWDSLHGANSWVPEPFGGSWKMQSCRPVKKRVGSMSQSTIAWVYKGWVTTGEPIRLAIHTSTTTAPESQKIIYTKTFVVEADRFQKSKKH